jgi:hypothetical protein
MNQIVHGDVGVLTLFVLHDQLDDHILDIAPADYHIRATWVFFQMLKQIIPSAHAPPNKDGTTAPLPYSALL